MAMHSITYTYESGIVLNWHQKERRQQKINSDRDVLLKDSSSKWNKMSKKNLL